MILGIREYSRPLNFESSYTVIQHAPEDSFELEIKPHALAQAPKLKDLLENRDFTGVVRASRDLRNAATADRRDSRRRRRHHFGGANGSRRSPESRSDWLLVQHPWVNNQLERTLARWAFKVCTAGGFEMPAFALADDGYLFLHDGKVYSGSDWMPQDRSINSLATKRGLVVRYPVRMKEDLLPYTKIPTSELRQLLARELDRQGCPETDALADRIATEQIELEGHVHSCTRRPRPRMGETTISTLSA